MKNQEWYIVNFMQTRVTRFFRLVYVFCFCLLQILIALRLDSTVTTSWFAVFLPWWFIEAFHFAVCVQTFLGVVGMGAIDESRPPASEDGTEDPVAHTRPLTLTEMLQVAVGTVDAWVLRIIQAVLLCIKLDGNSMSWAAVFIPCYLYSAAWAISILLAFLEVKRFTGPVSQLQEKKGRVYFMLVLLVISCILFYTFLGLLVKRFLTINPKGLIQVQICRLRV